MISDLKKIFIGFLILFGVLLHSQVFDFRIGPGFKIHSNNVDFNNPSSELEVPSIGDFFSNSFIFNSDFRFYSANHHKESESPFLGISYSYEKITSEKQDYGLLLGDDLKIQCLNLYAGFGKYIYSNSPDYFVFGYIGISFNNYSGETIDGSYKLKYNYKNARALRFALGQNIYLSKKHDFFINFLISCDLGSVERDHVNIYNNSIYVGKLEPVGDKILPDNNLSIFFNIGYSLNL